MLQQDSRSLVASLAAALTLAVAPGRWPASRRARPARRPRPRRPPLPTRPTSSAPPPVQVDTVYVAPPAPQKTITVHKVVDVGRRRGRVRGPEATTDDRAHRASAGAPRPPRPAPAPAAGRPRPLARRRRLDGRCAEAATRSAAAADRHRAGRPGGGERAGDRVPRRPGAQLRAPTAPHHGRDRGPPTRPRPSATSPATSSSSPARPRRPRRSSSRRRRPQPRVVVVTTRQSGAKP